MTKHQTAVERFAAGADALLRGGTPDPAWVAAFAPELALAMRLRAGAEAGIPDPAFVAGLREELRAAIAAAPRKENVVHYSVIDTPVGRLAVAYRDGRVVYCTAVNWQDVGQLIPDNAPATAAGEAANLPQRVGAGNPQSAIPAFERSVTAALGTRPQRDEAPPPALARSVREHLAGRRRLTNVDLSWLPPFQQKVLLKTAEIPRGEVRPYGWVAREIGLPGATRAVGTALGHNPIPFIIPCHRVVRSDGSLGEYSGGGPAVKERVLELEGAPVADLIAGARHGRRYLGSRTTHIVCYPSCHAARRIRADNAVPFASLSRAEAEGYRPCELCRPA